MTDHAYISRKLNVARLLCLLPGIFLIISGILLMFFPAAAKILYDLPTQQTAEGPMAIATGIRQFALGLIISLLAYRRQLSALSIVMIIGSIVPLTDFFAFRHMIGNFSALRHLLTVPVVLGLGIYIQRLGNRKIDNQ